MPRCHPKEVSEEEDELTLEEMIAEEQHRELLYQASLNVLSAQKGQPAKGKKDLPPSKGVTTHSQAQQQQAALAPQALPLPQNLPAPPPPAKSTKNPLIVGTPPKADGPQYRYITPLKDSKATSTILDKMLGQPVTLTS